MEGAEHQSLESRSQAAGAACETRASTARRAVAVKTRPSGDVRERLTPGADAEAAHELEAD